MKRSAMIERIYDVLNCDGVLEYSMPALEPVPLSEKHLRWIAEIILEEAEQAKMLPPSTYIKTFDKYDNVWEPEDEN